jgi:predicted ester cyclase
MATKENITRFAKVAEEVFNKGNVNAWDEIIDPEIIFHLIPVNDLKGLGAFKQFITAFLQGFTERNFKINEIIGESDTIAYRYTMHMKHTGPSPLYPIPPSGKEVALKSAVFFRWRNGKIVEAYEYADLLGFRQQLGLIPVAGKK